MRIAPAITEVKSSSAAPGAMIVFDLQCRDASCPGGETFEAWFRSSSDFDEQSAGGLVECPFCRSTNIAKAPMAPRVPRKGADDPLARLAAAQAELLRNSRWVGDQFTDPQASNYLFRFYRAILP